MSYSPDYFFLSYEPALTSTTSPLELLAPSSCSYRHFFLLTQSAKAKSCQFHQIIQNPFKFSRYHYHAHYCYWISPLAFSEPTKINIHTRTYINTYFKRVRPPLPLLPITIMYIDCDLSMGHYHCEYIFWIFLYFYYIHNVLPFHYSNIVIICVSLISFVIITIPLLDLN